MMKRNETTYYEFFKMMEENPSKECYVETHDGELTKILGWCEKNTPMLYITFSNGVTLECAEGHVFMDSKGDSIKAKDLVLNKRILTTKGSITVTSITKSKNDKAYDISIESPHWYVNDENGIIHHNTLTGLLCLKAYLDKYEDSVGMIYDSEFSITPEYLKTFGIDLDRVFITPITDLDKLKNDIINQIDGIERGEHVFILIDSIGNLASLKEVSDAQDGKSTIDMSRAKMLKSFFRMVTPRLNLKEIPMFTINHVFTEQTGGPYISVKISGGQGSVLACNSAIIISRRKSQNKDEEGYEFVMKIEKSRFIKEGLKLPLVIPKTGSIKKWSGMFDLALEYGYITQSGAWYEIPSLTHYEGKKVRKKDVENSDEFWNKIFTETNFIETVENDIKVSQDQSEIFENSIDDILKSVDEDVIDSACEEGQD